MTQGGHPLKRDDLRPPSGPASAIFSTRGSRLGGEWARGHGHDDSASSVTSLSMNCSSASEGMRRLRPMCTDFSSSVTRRR